MLFEPISNYFDHFFPVDWLCIVQNQNFLLLLGLAVLFLRVEPCLVFFMNSSEIIKGNGVFAFSRAGLNAFLANFRRALNIDDSCEIDDLVHGDEVIVELEVD